MRLHFPRSTLFISDLRLNLSVRLGSRCVGGTCAPRGKQGDSDVAPRRGGVSDIRR